MTKALRWLHSLDPLLPEADAFLLDQFGTLHDGVTLYPGVAEAVVRLKAAGKRIVILSNSGKRSSQNVARLACIGLPETSYDGFLTSGEVAWQLLARRSLPALAGARRCLVLSRGPAPEALAGLDLDATEEADTADLILLLGSEADRIGLGAYRSRLAAAARRGVPCLCGNPDRLMVLGGGGLAPAAGQIAELYADMGGAVIWIGKPGAAIYEAAFEMLRPMLSGPLDRARIWAVGDSIEHDVAGAALTGCRSLLVLTGIMAGKAAGTVEDESRRGGFVPNAVVPAFC